MEVQLWIFGFLPTTHVETNANKMRPRSPHTIWVIDQNNILTVLIHNLKSALPIKSSMLFLSSLEKLLSDAYNIFLKRDWQFWDRVQNILILVGVQYPPLETILLAEVVCYRVSQKSAIVTRVPFCKILNNFWKLTGWYEYYINRLHV